MNKVEELFDKMLDCVMLIAEDGSIAYVNDPTCILYGYTREEFAKLNVADLDRISMREAIEERVLKSFHISLDFNAIHTKKDGSEIFVRIKSSGFQHSEHRYVVMILQDMTLYYDTQLKYKEAEAAIEQSKDAILIFDRQFHVHGWNSAAERLFGFSRAVDASAIIKSSVPEDRILELSSIKQHLENGKKITEFLTERINAEGERIPVMVAYMPILGPEGEIYSYVGTYREMTGETGDGYQLEYFQKLATIALEGGSFGIWNYHVDMGRVEVFNHLQERRYVVVNTKDCIIQLSEKDRQHARSLFMNLSRDHDTLEADIETNNKLIPGIRFLHIKGKAYEFNEDGRPVKIVGTLEDISERRRMQEQLKEKNKELEALVQLAGQASQAKSDFLANMSHEIRTPLNGILMAVSAIEKMELSASQKRIFSVIESSCQTLNGTLTDILDFSKIESGECTAKKVPVELPELVKKTINEIQMEAMHRGFECSFFFDPALNIELTGDPQLTKQVLNNLISNAFKFTEEGTIGFRVRLQRKDEEHAWVLFEVSDTGCGISSSTAEKIFEPFVQGEDTFTKRHQGTGLGLVISRRCAQLMGGSLTYESQEGKGSVFRFLCRYEIGAAPKPKSEGITAQVKQNGMQKRILSVDDNLVNQELLKFVLEDAGYLVGLAYSADEAEEYLARQIPDLILMDIQLPGKNGYMLTQGIRENDLLSQTPIIAMTAYTRKADFQKCLGAGMNDYIPKPIKTEDLLHKIAQFTKQDR